jgi:glycerophosphoryl diester phosphodiesterase
MLNRNAWLLWAASHLLLMPFAGMPTHLTFVAHRGGIMPGYPENTLAAYRQAIKMGAQVIEIDLRGTQDGEIVIMHDETLDRTTKGHGQVSKHTLPELLRLDAGQDESIPTFEQVLELVQGTGVKLLLDIKEGRTLNKEQTVRLVRKHKAEQSE